MFHLSTACPSFLLSFLPPRWNHSEGCTYSDHYSFSINNFLEYLICFQLSQDDFCEDNSQLSTWAWMSLLFNMLSRFSFKEQASFNFLAVITSCSDFGSQENKVSHSFHCFPLYLSWSDGTRCHDLSVLNVVLSQLFHSPLSLSSEAF